MSKVEEVSTPYIVVRFEARRCVHSRNCVLGNPTVFVPNAPGGWIHPEAASVEEVVALAHACPSGAITYERRDGKAQEHAPLVNTVRVRENGPLALNADMRIVGRSELRATLCRCGASKHKPYCDGSHSAAQFVATGEPPSDSNVPSLPARDGALEVTPLPNGPLHVKGNVEICSGTGRTLSRKTECWLCRCGQSQNKPYCDGSHTKAGFTA